MQNEDDFTFCQVGSPAGGNGQEATNLAEDIGSITIKSGTSNGPGNGRDGGIVWSERLMGNSASTKQATVGSLSFNVIDTSFTKQSSESSRQVSSTDVGTSAENVEGKKVFARKPASRAKVPFEKGYSQMDWLKLTRTHPDLAGLKGQSNRRPITMKEVKQHQSGNSMWTVLKGRVYNIAPYMKFHPGGDEILMKAVGKDCTFLFNKYHAWVNADFLLEKCLVGILDDGEGTDKK